MQTDFPYLEVPEEFFPIVGKPDEGTRVYRRDGAQEESGPWFDVVSEIAGESISPGGVGMYCPVSRAAVYKRMKEGKLTAFLFQVTYHKTTLFGGERKVRERPYCYIPASECRAWAKELEERALAQGKISLEELNDAKPDWHGEFIDWKNKKERADLFDSPEMKGKQLQFLWMLLKGFFQDPKDAYSLPKNDGKTRKS